MRRFTLLVSGCLVAWAMTACVSTYKARQHFVIYDFGLPVHGESNQPIDSRLTVEEFVAADYLNHNKIRYRLNYQSPARIFFYSESRWAAAPPELLSSRLSTMMQVIQPSQNCSLRLKIETFDHVFQTASVSEGVVQFNASLVEKKTRKVISSQFISESAPAPMPNAQGGVDALRQAGTQALGKALDWANATAVSSASCR